MLGRDKLEMATIVTWKLWEIRNRKLHCELAMDFSEVLSWCDNFLAVYRQQLQPSPPSSRVERTEVWIPPPPDSHKVNFDAAFPVGSNFYRIAAVARDSQGMCIKWVTKRIRGRPSVADGEAHAAMLAAELAARHTWRSVILEGDCKTIIDAANEGDFHTYSFGAYLEGIFNLLTSVSHLKFQFVRRSCNRLAHYLASFDSSDCCEGDSLPPHLADLAY
ncbi:PREDICTED: uncharacterized protein LOC105962754 [Erythranthe guttata]|uniref:uncharacterized protein LOC105962754 n=1 Tax=Erythranthe guttata TaxID=4155 RepID=UPI00064D9B61|nr:PREDICTED: uncharacterized protein LOC105962754 [Erythranthe guttata]|eukprot:XP_012842532.1 PREDICTED: uncharacterized protein LOC105962754 [Erythranthe guttata]